jgi:FMN-dependent NADH-azoreductase
MTTSTPHLLHIDSSIQGEQSVSRGLSRRAVDGWLAANPGGTVTYRDLHATPPPHLEDDGWTARFAPEEQHTEAQAAAYTRFRELIGEIEAADAVVLGLPLYNYGPPSTVKAWIDHIVVPGLSVEPDISAGLLGGRRFVALVARGGGYMEGAPHFGWDHLEPWLPHILSMVGLEPEIIVAELTLANVNPALAELRPLADRSLGAAHAAIDGLWAPVPSAR